MKIREVDPSDAEEIVKELWLPLAREMEQVSDYNELKKDFNLQVTIQHKREKLEHEDSFYYLAEKDGETVGHISADVKDSAPVFNRGKKLKINEIFVKEKFRRQNIASKLMEKMEESAESEDCDRIELDVNVRNESAQKLYEEHGFETEKYRMVKNIT